MHQISTRFDYYIELLEYLSRTTATAERPTHLVVCTSREDFHQQITRQILRQSVSATTHIAAEPNAIPSPSEDNVHNAKFLAHPLLIPTLQLLAVSQHIRLTYCPSIPTLRAVLSATAFEKRLETAQRPCVYIVDMLALHHSTSEFTLQGLSRTLAAAVSAAHNAGADLTLVECRDVQDPSHPDRGSRLWDRQIPLLSGSVKIGLEGSRWSGRALTIKKIASRWFEFESVMRGQVEQEADMPNHS